MATYKYKALKENKTIIEGEIEALSLREAREKIRVLGFIPTKVYSEELPESVKVEKPEVKTKRLSLAQKIAFTSELEVLLSSGISILDALNSIGMNAFDEQIKEIAQNLEKGVMSGMTFAHSMSSLYQNAFGNVYIALVQTGEDAGELEVTLGRMLELLRKQDSIKGRIIKASIYPAILIVMMLALVILFAKYVFPAFAGLMAFNGQDLPVLAASIIGTMNFINKFWWLVLIVIGAGCGAIVQLFKTPEIKSKWDEFILKVPVVSEFINYVNLSNFMSVLHVSYEAGLPIISGLELANKTVGNYNIKTKIFNSINIIRSGKGLSEAFRKTGAIPSSLLSMISAGEKSGTLGKMFKDAADVIDKKVDMALEAMTRLFEPTVIIIIAVGVLFLAIAFYQAYFGMLNSLF